MHKFAHCTISQIFLSYFSHLFYVASLIFAIENYSSANVRNFHCEEKKFVKSCQLTEPRSYFHEKKKSSNNSTFFESRSSFSRKIRQIDYSSFSTYITIFTKNSLSRRLFCNRFCYRSECNLTNFPVKRQ